MKVTSLKVVETSFKVFITEVVKRSTTQTRQLSVQLKQTERNARLNVLLDQRGMPDITTSQSQRQLDFRMRFVRELTTHNKRQQQQVDA